MNVRPVAVSVAALALTPAPAAGAVRVAVPDPGEVTVSVVTTKRPPAGSQRADRVLRVANARRLSRRVAVYAGKAPSCSNATRNRFTAVVVVTRRRPDSGGARQVVLDGVGSGASVRGCGSYPVRSRFAGAAIRRLRCDRLTARPPRSIAPLLLGSAATCIGGLQRRLRVRSPYQLPLNLDLGTTIAEGPAAARNITSTARLVGKPRHGVFRYAMSVQNV